MRCAIFLTNNAICQICVSMVQRSLNDDTASTSSKRQHSIHNAFEPVRMRTQRLPIITTGSDNLHIPQCPRYCCGYNAAVNGKENIYKSQGDNLITCRVWRACLRLCILQTFHCAVVSRRE